MKEQIYELIIWFDGGPKQSLGIHTETFCRAYCKAYAGKDNGFHVQCKEVDKQ